MGQMCRMSIAEESHFISVTQCWSINSDLRAQQQHASGSQPHERKMMDMLPHGMQLLSGDVLVTETMAAPPHKALITTSTTRGIMGTMKSGHWSESHFLSCVFVCVCVCVCVCEFRPIDHMLYWT
jgi:hypothetical protein